MKKPDRYVGIDNDVNGGMTTIGKIVRDAWAFELIPETETCEGWNVAGINALLQKINAEWDKYGCMVSQLPEPLAKRHFEINQKAIERAHAAGWTGEVETDNAERASRCGKSRFVEYMAWKLKRPLITVTCNENMTASDLIGRFLLDKDGTK